MKKILILTGRYNPIPSVNGVCVKNIVEELQKDNYEVTCICYDDGNQINNSNEKVYRVKRGLLHTIQYKIENKTFFGHRILKKIISLLLKLKQLLFLYWWPYNDPLFTKKVYKLATKLQKKEKFFAVISVHMPLSSIIVGHKLKQNNPDIKFYPYFLDSLSGGRPLRIKSEEWNINKKLKWEDKLLNNADKIIVMESSRNHNERYNKYKYYYSNYIYLDIPLIKDASIQNNKTQVVDDKISVLFCGTANYPMRDLNYFLNLISFIEDENIVFTFIGESNYPPLIQSKKPNVRYYPFVSHNKLSLYYNAADVLLNLGVKTPSAISGKIFEYMSYGKPIISTYSISNEACLSYLNKYPIKFLIDERKSNLEELAKELSSFIRNNYKNKIDFDSIETIFALNKPSSFVKKLFE